MRLVDTIVLLKCEDDACTTTTRVDATGKGISWPSDRNAKFRNPVLTKEEEDLCDAAAFDSSAFTKVILVSIVEHFQM